MKIEKTNLTNVLRITPDKFKDHRGYYIETYNKNNYKKNGISINFIQDDISVSFKNVLRGIHGDQETWKLISCLVEILVSYLGYQRMLEVTLIS